MKFYGRGIVWDKENKKALCEFTNGELETTDERTIILLSEAGFQKEETPPVIIKKSRKKKND